MNFQYEDVKDIIFESKTPLSIKEISNKSLMSSYLIREMAKRLVRDGEIERVENKDNKDVLRFKRK